MSSSSGDGDADKAGADVVPLLSTTAAESSPSPANPAAAKPNSKTWKLPLEERIALARKGPTLVFDGICNLCNGSMAWFQDRTRPDRPVWYMWAQHLDTHEFLMEIGITRQDILKSWAYIEDDVVYRGSTAWLAALRNLTPPWCYLGNFQYMPEFIRESVYNTVAANRYNALGHSDSCQRPQPEMKARFLHSTAIRGADSEEEAKIPPTRRRRLLVVGCGPAGLFVAKKMARYKDYEVVVVEPKDYFEFTPGMLRGLCDEKEMDKLVFELEPVLCDQLGAGLIQGCVTAMESNSAKVRLVKSGVYRSAKKFPNEEDDGSKGPFIEEGDDSEIVTINFDYCVVATGSQYATSSLWKVPLPSLDSSDADSHPTYTLQGRLHQLASERQRLQSLHDSQSGHISIFGAGLVGVELAAEIVHYFPGIGRVQLFDPQPTVLPPLPEKARKYASDWLEKRGVELVLGQEFTQEGADQAEKESDVAYKCVGVRVKADFMPSTVRDERGQVRVNSAMQVVLSDPSPNDVDQMGRDRAAIFGSGRIFAIGDCVSVQGVEKPYVKHTYPAEAMAEVVVENLLRARTVQCLRTCPGQLRELRENLMVMTLCSLGPSDATFTINDTMLAYGRAATTVKSTVQYTKMSDSKNEILGKTFWSAVPHW